MHQQITERTVDLDPRETAEWLEALDQIVDEAGSDRVYFLLDKLLDRARDNGVEVPPHHHRLHQHHPRGEEVPYPGDRALERRIKSLMRWNAMAMVSHQNKYDDGIGGHISTYASLATLLEVGFNHFFHGSYGDQPGDLIYFQGHASPGIYARAFLEGRLSEEQLNNFRHELRGTPGPLLLSASLADEGFLAVPHRIDGHRTHQLHLPGSFHALSGKSRPDSRHRRARSGRSWAMAKWTSPNRPAPSASPPREKLDNLIFVINCNLQRLDGPVRGNGKIIRNWKAYSAAPAGT